MTMLLGVLYNKNGLYLWFQMDIMLVMVTIQALNLGFIWNAINASKQRFKLHITSVQIVLPVQLLAA